MTVATKKEVESECACWSGKLIVIVSEYERPRDTVQLARASYRLLSTFALT